MTSTDLDVRVLGPTVVLADGEALAVGGPRPRRLLAALAVDVGHTVSADRLVQRIWGDDPPATARHALQVHVSTLRKRLGPAGSRLETMGTGYRLDLDPDGVDATRFASLARQGHALLRHGDPARALRRYTAALSLWRGPLDDLEHAPEVAGRLVEQHLRAREELHAARLELGQVDAVIDGVEELVAEHPLREGPYALLMLALYRAGRQSEALAVFQRARRTLVDELGVEPGPRLVAVERAVLDHDPDIVVEVTGPGTGHVPAPTGLVGRERELTRIVEAVAAGRRGRGGLVVVAGEAGIGKSALLAEVRRSAEADGTLVGAARCRLEARAVPCWPLQHALADIGDGALEDLVASLAATDGGEGGPAAAIGARVRGQAALAAALSRRGEHTPLLVVIDDLHWSDQATLDALGHLAPELAASRVVVLVATRADGPEADAVTELAARLRRERSAAWVELGPLTAEATGRLVAEVLGAAPDRDVVARIHDQSGGNPLFAGELARRSAEGRPTVGGAGDASLETLVDERLAQVEPRDRALLAVAAAAGDELDLELLGLVLGDDEGARHGAGRLGALGILTSGTVPRFRHGLVRDRVLLGLEDRAGADAHDRLASALLEHRPHEREAAAFHAVAALPVGSAERALGLAMAEGRRAASLLAHGDAAVWFERAVRAARALGRDQDLVPALAAQADAATRSGRLRQARPVLDELVVRARQLGDGRSFARAVVLRTVDRSPAAVHERSDLIGLLHEARAMLGDDRTELKVRILDLLLLAGYLSSPPEEQLALADEALDLARTLDDETLALALNGRMMAVASPDDVAERAELAGSAVALGRRAGSAEAQIVGHAGRMLALLELGRAAEADAELARAEVVAEWSREPRFLWQVGSWEALRRLRRGELASAERTMAGAVARWDGDPPVDALVNQAVHTITLRLLAGRAGEGAPIAEAFAAQMPDVPLWQVVHALCCAHAGDLDRARRSLEVCLAGGVGRFRRDVTWLAALSSLAEVCWLVDERGPADDLARALGPYGDRHVVLQVFGGGANHWGCTRHALGLLADLAGDTESARRHLEASVRADEGADAAPFAARSRAALARVGRRR